MSVASRLHSGMTRFMRSPERPNAHQPERGYLGMSGIGYCPRQQYWRVVDPQPADDRLHWYNWIGYEFEDMVLRLVRGAGFVLADAAKPQDIVASFDHRFRGHIDHLLLEERTVIDVKSVYWSKFQRIRESGAVEAAHVDQVQMYMRHGNFDHGVVIYAARDVPYREWDRVQYWTETEEAFLAFCPLDVPKDETRSDELDDKARAILAAVDRGQPPACTCSWCDR